MTDGRGPWRTFLDSVLERRDERTPFILARIALLTDSTLQTPGHVTVSEMPAGRPDRAVTREAAAALLEYDQDTNEPLELTWRFLGLQQRFKHYKDPRAGEPDELPTVLASMTEVLRIGAALGPDTHAWALLRHAQILRNAHRNDEARDFADRAVGVLSGAGDAPETPFALLDAAVGGSSWFRSQQMVRRYLLMRAHDRAAVTSRMLRDYSRAIAERDRHIEVARSLLAERPWLLVDALGQRATLARDLGDVASSLRLLDEQEAVTQASESRPARVRQLLSAASAAQFLDDWEGSVRLRRERIEMRLEPHGGVPATAPGPLLDVVFRLEEAGQRAALTGLGNDAYDIARCLIESGQAEVEPVVLDEARQWLAVAEAAWRDVALNGKVAVGFRRLQIDAMQGSAGDPVDIGRQMVGYSRAWRRAKGQRRAAVIAVRHGDAGDPVILDRLTEMIDNAPPVDAAHLHVGLARWHLRHGHVLAAQGRADEAQAAWAQATQNAEAAALGLSVDRADGPPVLLNPAAVLDAYRIQAEAIRARRSAGSRSAEISTGAELTVRVASLPAVAQRFTASGTRRQRQVLEALYRDWLEQTLRLAVEVGDLTAADHTAEVMRRDLVGSVLYAIADDPLTPQQIAGLARQLTASLSARPIADESETGAAPAADQDDEGGPAVNPHRRARGIAEQLDETLDVVGTVLGPVARSLFDPRTVLQHTAHTAARSLYPDGGGVLLSLVLVTGADGPHVVRRMTWRTDTDDELHDHLDVVEAPHWLPSLAVDDAPETFFARVARLTDVLLPRALVDLLAAADPDRPVPLTVVPTGLLAVPFAALPAAGRLVLDVAVVSVVQSLQAIETLARPGVEPAVNAVEVGVYDTVRLRHASYEWEELCRHHPAVKAASTLAELSDIFGNPRAQGSLGVFALAIHGTRGSDGWTQAKQLPSGETLTSGHVLQWYLPTLVVGASCNTDIRADAGGELGGFPLAFQLRGAIDIIGSLHYIEDEATAQIMARFYAATGAGRGAAAALRQAQRNWIAEDRAQRLPAMRLWAFLLCYGLPV